MDPADGDEESSISLHRYSFAKNSPLSYVDPSGYVFLSDVMATISLIGITASLAHAGVAGGEIKMGISVPNGFDESQNNLFDAVAAGSSDQGRWARENTGVDMLNYMMLQSRGRNSIKVLTIASHGWRGAVEIPGFNGGPGIPGVPIGSQSGFYTSPEDGVSYGPGAAFMRDFVLKVNTKQIKFAENSLIQIHACHVDPAFSNALSSITDGTVVSAAGSCYPHGIGWRSGPESYDEKKSGRYTGFYKSTDGSAEEAGEYYVP